MPQYRVHFFYDYTGKRESRETEAISVAQARNNIRYRLAQERQVHPAVINREVEWRQVEQIGENPQNDFVSNPPKSLVVHEPDLDIDIEVEVKVHKEIYDVPIYSLYIEGKQIGRIARRESGNTSMVAWYDEDSDSFCGFTFNEAVERMVSRWSDTFGSNPPAQTLYHVTTDKVATKIAKKGIMPLQTSNWVKAGSKERYGGGEIFAFDHPLDAMRWASHMDWEFNKEMGSGKIVIVEFTDDAEWEIDDADPLSQIGRKGNRLKRFGSVKPEQIVSITPLTQEYVRRVVAGNPVEEFSMAPVDLTSPDRVMRYLREVKLPHGIEHWDDDRYAAYVEKLKAKRDHLENWMFEHRAALRDSDRRYVDALHLLQKRYRRILNMLGE